MPKRPAAEQIDIDEVGQITGLSRMKREGYGFNIDGKNVVDKINREIIDEVKEFEEMVSYQL